MLEYGIETRICAALRSLGVSGVEVRGLWGSAAAGAVKGADEESAAAARFVVAVSPRSYDTVGLPQVSVECSILLESRTDADPEGAVFAAGATAVAAMLHGWNARLGCCDNCGLAVEGLFTPAAITVSGGSAPELDADRHAWTAAWTFTLRGIAR